MAREVIDLSPGKRKRITVCSYGKPRSGKTRFLATFPRPLIIADRSEGGWETMRYMPDDAFYEHGRRPTVWPVENSSQMLEAIRDAKAMKLKGTDEFFTIGVDSFTFYADAFIAQLETAAYNRSGGKPIDRRHIYQEVGGHLRYVMISLHELADTNIVWLMLEKPAGEDSADGGMLLPGQAAQKTPARCDSIFYHRSFRPNDSEPPVFEVRTRSFGSYNAGGRDEGILPDPMVPSYRVLEEVLKIQSPLGATRKIAAAK